MENIGDLLRWCKKYKIAEKIYVNILKAHVYLMRNQLMIL